jgi:2-keto-4-pentenoate hydratase
MTGPADPRIRAGMERQLERRRRMIAEGAHPIGWKLGFGSPAAMERLSLNAPLVGFLTDATIIRSGSAVTIGTWTRPVVEPELAVYMGSDLVDGSNRDATRAAVAAVGAAIELADVDVDLFEVEPILTANIFHRGVVLGKPDYGRAGARLDGLTARVAVAGADVATTTELTTITGDTISIVGSLADLLAGYGERLRAGELVITGSLIPPLPGVAPSEVSFWLDPLEPITVGLF